MYISIVHSLQEKEDLRSDAEGKREITAVTVCSPFKRRHTVMRATIGRFRNMAQGYFPNELLLNLFGLDGWGASPDGALCFRLKLRLGWMK